MENIRNLSDTDKFECEIEDTDLQNFNNSDNYLVDQFVSNISITNLQTDEINSSIQFET